MAALRSIATYLGLSLYVLIAGPPLLAIALLARNPSLLYTAGHIAVRIGSFLSGIRCRVEGAEHIQRHRSAVYAVNHTSNVEPALIYDALQELFPRLRVLYKAELRKLPILRNAFDIAEFIPLERGNRDQSLPAIDRAADALREGNSFLIFPEGTRSRTGELLPFKKGGFIMALKAQAPVVPVAIIGARDAMRKGSFVINPVVVRLQFGQPVETIGMTLEDRDSLVAAVRQRIEAMLIQ